MRKPTKGSSITLWLHEFFAVYSRKYAGNAAKIGRANKAEWVPELKIEKLGVKLMVPLGLGVLPAFVFLAIVPLMVTTLGAN